MPGMGVSRTGTPVKKAGMTLMGKGVFLITGPDSQRAAVPEAGPRPLNCPSSPAPPPPSGIFHLRVASVTRVTWELEGPRPSAERVCGQCILGKGKLRARLQQAPTLGAPGAERPENPPRLQSRTLGSPGPGSTHLGRHSPLLRMPGLQPWGSCSRRPHAPYS